MSEKGVSIGFKGLDEMMGGLKNSELIVIAGRPSMGKTAFAISLLEHIAMKQEITTVFFSLGMPKEQFVERMFSFLSCVNLHKIRTGLLSRSDWSKMIPVWKKLSGAPIYLDDTPAISTYTLRTKARRYKANYGIGLIIVDYLQLMKGTSKAESRQQEISEISRSIKVLARELNIPIIAISQLPRKVEERHGSRPLLSDLRQYGEIDMNADSVLLIFREEYYNPTKENRGRAEITLAKNRTGPVGVVNLEFISDYVRFNNKQNAAKE